MKARFYTETRKPIPRLESGAKSTCWQTAKSIDSADPFHGKVEAPATSQRGTFEKEVSKEAERVKVLATLGPAWWKKRTNYYLCPQQVI